MIGICGNLSHLYVFPVRSQEVCQQRELPIADEQNLERRTWQEKRGCGIIQREIVLYLKPNADNLSLQTACIAREQHRLRFSGRDRDAFVIERGGCEFQ